MPADSAGGPARRAEAVPEGAKIAYTSTLQYNRLELG
jgi:hypothetical protein